MIGPKKLSTIREDLRRALAATGDDPIRWLEEHVAASERNRQDPSAESEVLLSLRRILSRTAGEAKR